MRDDDIVPLIAKVVKGRKNILYVQFPWRMSLVRLDGVYRYARENGWRVQVAEYGRSTESISRMLSFWNPDGCIVEGGCLEVNGFDRKAFGKIPVVYCDAQLPSGQFSLPGVVQDSSDAVAFAAKELLSLGLEDYAFVGYLKRRIWSDQRRDLFMKTILSAGKRCHIANAPDGQTIDDIVRHLGPFLSSIPKPCGIFAANDLVGELVLHCCRQLGISVPDSVAVVGVDDDRLICENSTPTLTSVAPDFWQSGYLAAKLLGELIDNPKKKRDVVTFGAVGIVRRASTRRFARRDDAVRKAIERVRTESSSGLTARQVAAGIGGSRRNAEMRFRALAGKAIGEAIVEQRIACAKDLLHDRSIPIDSIYFKCGYRSNGSLRKAFRRVTGMSLREWRDGC